MTIKDALLLLRKVLGPTLGSFAGPQSEEILQYLLNCSRSELFLSKGKSLSHPQIQRLHEILNERLNGKPLQYILGKTFFYSREFKVTSDTLIPRPDTEILIEQVLIHERTENAFFADIGIGSGIISCILTEERPAWRAVGIDISFSTLKIAKENSTTPLLLLCSDLLSALKLKQRFHFIVSNPPYISMDEMNVLDPEVKEFEPHRALYGGEDGLDFYRRLSIDCKSVLQADGRLYCEIGYNQQNAVMDIFRGAGWADITITKDLSGHPRVLRAVYMGSRDE